jgi:hypothetical protein
MRSGGGHVCGVFRVGDVCLFNFLLFLEKFPSGNC